MNDKIYRARHGEITVGTLIKESPKSFSVECERYSGPSYIDRFYRKYQWSGRSGGNLYQTEMSFRHLWEAIIYADKQIAGLQVWIDEHNERAENLRQEICRLKI